MFLAIGGLPAGLIVVPDPIKDSAIEAVTALRRDGVRVVMLTGDNRRTADAVARKVGIAMGNGTDVAMESASVTLVRGDLAGIVQARRLSKATMRNIRENLFFSFVFNAAGILLAAGVLYSWFGLLLCPMVAGAAMAFSSVAVIGNSLRLRTLRLQGITRGP
jgi:cation transport ATPase